MNTQPGFPGQQFLDRQLAEGFVRPPDLERWQVAGRRHAADHRAIDGAKGQRDYKGADYQHGNQEPTPDDG